MEEKATNGKLFWLKLEQNFFNQKEIKLLRRIEGGDTYVIIYLKMMLTSLADNGKLYYEGLGDDFADELAMSIDEDKDHVVSTLEFLKHYGFVAKISETEYELPAVLGMTGKKTEAAVRKEQSRAKQKQAMCDNVTNESQSCHDVSQNVTQRRVDQSLDSRSDLDSRSELREDIKEDPNKEPIEKGDSSSGYEPIEENSQDGIDYIPSGDKQDLNDDVRHNDSDVVDLFMSVTGISNRNYIEDVITNVFYNNGIEPNVVYIYMSNMLDYLADIIKIKVTCDHLGNRNLDIVDTVANEVKEMYEQRDEVPF